MIAGLTKKGFYAIGNKIFIGMRNPFNIDITDTLYEHESVHFCRGTLSGDGTPVLLKIPLEVTAETASVILEWEKSVIDSLAGEGVIRAVRVADVGRDPAIVLENHEGLPLALTARRGIMTAPEILRLALSLALIVSRIHEKGVVHGNLSPWAIFISNKPGRELPDAALTRFECSFLSGDAPEAVIAGRHFLSLPYISPEATGKLDRAPDARSDLYSLGAVLYELTSGRPPFTGDRPADLAYAHLSATPEAPELLNPGLPSMVSKIIMKLLEKNPDDRYQGARGLAADLRKCLEQTERGSIIRPFKPGSLDDAERPSFPERLYDRENEIESLARVYDAVAAGGSILAMVAGEAGVGKTALVGEFSRMARKRGAFFITGKFDQYRSNIPFSAFIEAFRELTRSLLMGTGREIGEWRAKLSNALSPNAALIAELIPELTMIIGDQGSVPPSAPLSSKNRLHLYIAKFLSVFASAGSPLFIFLDDLHRADPASLGLLWMLSADEGLGHIGIIGSYRSNELGVDHPLSGLLKTISHDREIISLSPRPLGRQAIARAIADMFRTSPARTGELADLVHGKTMGVPFFVREFLGAIAHSPLVRRGPRGGYRWDAEGIRRLPVTDNMVDFLTQRIRGLSGGEQECLMTASCIGTSFDSDLLRQATGMDGSAILSHLSTLAGERLIIPDGAQYRFAHDKVQEAARRMMAEQVRTAAHSRIGNILFDGAVRSGSMDSVFSAVDQLNQAAGIMTVREKVELADLNYLAGRMARRQASFKTALDLFKKALDLLLGAVASPDEAWARYPHLAYVIHRDLAEAEFLNGNADRVDTVIHDALSYVSDPIDKAELSNVLLLQYGAQFTRHREALAIGLRTLGSLGIEIDTGDAKRSLETNMERVQYLIAGRDAPAFLDHPLLKDEKLKMALKILRNTSLPAVYIDFEIADIIILCMIGISIESGNAPESVVGYLHYGRMLAMRFDRLLEGYRFGGLAVDLARRLEAKSLICESSLIFANFIAPRYLPHDELERINQTGLAAGREAGELKYTGDIYSHMELNSYCMGRNLNSVLEQTHATAIFLKKVGDRFDIDINEALSSVIRFLKDDAPDGREHLREKEDFLRLAWSESGHSIPLNFFYLYVSQAEFILGNYESSYQLILRAKSMVGLNMGMTSINECYHYQSLSITARYPGSSLQEKDELMAVLSRNREIQKSLAETCPGSFMHKHLLVEAETARVTGRDIEAMDLYDRSIDAARMNGFTQDEAVACELAGKFWLGRGKNEFAGIYLVKAYDAYRKWGAGRKVRDCEERYAAFIAKDRRRDSADRLGSGRRKGDRNPFAEPLIDISQKIMGEIHLDRLHEIILTTAVKHVSAKKGFIIMERHGDLFVEAEIDPSNQEVRIPDSRPLAKASLPRSIVRYCARTGETVDLDEEPYAGMFMTDPYIKKFRPKSVLCMKLGFQGKTSSIIYLENSLLANAFSVIPQEVLSLLSSGMTIALENARLYREQEESITLRDRLLRQYEDSRNKNLQERMRPHFIYNAIHTIHALLRIDPGRADAALLNFAEISRYFSYRSFESLVPFNEEWRFTQGFLEFERIRLKERFAYTMEISGNFGDILVPPLIIQPLAGNSVKHGLKNMISGGVIAITANRNGDTVAIEVRDNGSGLTTKDPFSRTLGNIRDRLRYHFRDADMTVTSMRGRGVRASITFTVTNEERHEREA